MLRACVKADMRTFLRGKILKRRKELGLVQCEGALDDAKLNGGCQSPRDSKNKARKRGALEGNGQHGLP